MAMTGTRFTNVRSSTTSLINKSYHYSRNNSLAQRSISTVSAYKFKNIIEPTKKYAVKQTGVECDFVTNTYLKSQWSPPRELPWYQHLYKGSHSHVKTKKVANRVDSGTDIVKLWEQHGPLKLRFGGITEEGTRFLPESFHCKVLRHVWKLPNGKLVGLFYDPEGLPNTSDVEKLIAHGDMNGYETEDDVPPDEVPELNKIKDQFVVKDLNEIAQRSTILDPSQDGYYAIDREKSEPKDSGTSDS